MATVRGRNATHLGFGPCYFVVLYRIAGLPHGEERRYSGASQLDDTQFRVESGSSDVAKLPAIHAFGIALVFPPDVHYRRVALLGSNLLVAEWLVRRGPRESSH